MARQNRVRTNGSIVPALRRRIRSTIAAMREYASLQNRTISTIMFYVTNRCNSRCKHCAQWRKPEKVDMPLWMIRDVINSSVLSNQASFGLEGGEFLLHPNCEKILDLFPTGKVIIQSNGILVERLARLITIHADKIRELQLSLDGGPETYRLLRGVDEYGSTIEAIRRLKDKVPISISFTFTPWSSVSDYFHVKRICEENGVKLGWNLYANMEYFDARARLHPIPDDMLQGDKREAIPEYVRKYNPWLEGTVKIPCLSINRKIVIYPNGDVPLCQQGHIRLGNLSQDSLDDIWNRTETKQKQMEHLHCNQCWIIYHRNYDLLTVNKICNYLPQFLCDRVLGKGFVLS